MNWLFSSNQHSAEVSLEMRMSPIVKPSTAALTPGRWVAKTKGICSIASGRYPCLVMAEVPERWSNHWAEFFRRSVCP